MTYSRQAIRNRVLRVLSEGNSTNDALDMFLMMNMSNDLGEERPFITKGPTLSDISMHLLGNGVIGDEDIKVKMFKGLKMPVQRLVVKLSPSCTIYAETSRNVLLVNINDKSIATTSIRHLNAEDIAMWIIRQKQNLDRYMGEWETVLTAASKKTKGNRLSMLAIKAIVTEAMKEFPAVKYDFIEQKRRMRIKVNLPNSRLGVFIDAWWGSYKDRLPTQLASLKTLIEAHSKSTLKDFFISNR